jgi:exopolysaccharide biosynthesis polyprenyl glycosylphosphotransferase
MSIRNKKEPILLFIGDVLIFSASLFLALVIRYAGWPSWNTIGAHIPPFTILFAVWVVVYYISGLYGKHTLVLKSRLPNIILNSQIVNSVLAISFFYFIPFFIVTPKVTLFLHLGVSFTAILAWRVYGHPLLGFRRKQRALLIGSSSEMRELHTEVNRNQRYNLVFSQYIDLNDIESLDIQKEVIEYVYSRNIGVIVVDFSDERIEPLLPHLYNLIFAHVRFVDMYKVYEDIFDRVPLSLLHYSWFMENISLSPSIGYDILKRAMDFILTLILCIASLPLYPLIALAIKLDDRGPIFVMQKRTGRNNHHNTLFKFRTMTYYDGGSWGEKGSGNQDNQVTRAGHYLRKTRLDEIPQLWNVLKGDLSLIGPRPEFPQAVAEYEKQIPYYGIRHLIKPGLSGWAQIHHMKHPHHIVDITETKNKLSFDLYYIKNRSFMLDLKIALKTLRILMSRSGA